jgi:thioredoxin reductase (NADPH)
VKYWILPDIENRIKAGEIRALFSTTVCEIRPHSLLVRTPEGEKEHPADFVFVLVGFLPDSARLREFGVELDPGSLAPQCKSDSLETMTPGLYVAGSVVAGRNTNKVFVENGRLHGKTIVQDILWKRGLKS